MEEETHSIKSVSGIIRLGFAVYSEAHAKEGELGKYIHLVNDALKDI